MSSLKLRKEKDCLNCGHYVEENYCPHCGQENIELKEDALHLVAHTIADYFHFEHKFFATLKPLLFQPGKLTQTYVAGKRQSFINPIRLYIFVSIVFFIAVLGGVEIGNSDKKKKSSPQASTHLIRKDSLDKIRQEEELARVMSYIPMDSAQRDTLLGAMKEEIKKDAKKKGKRKDYFPKWTDTSVAQYEQRQSLLPKSERDNFIEHYLIKRNIELNDHPDPQKKFFTDLIQKIPKMMFVLLPLFALILKIFYFRRRKYYYEHLIYSFHVHSALFLSVLLMMFLSWITGFIMDISGWLSFLCIVYMIWYIYRSLRTFYGSSRWNTIAKLFGLFMVYNFLLALCFTILMAISFVMI